ncbi:MAG: hypothetical protein EOP36_07270 [Rubrivivax sp.]|nr:MAG: hypothetical protein EOP36_07270 [Rubrivivax sp.]
MDDIPQWKQRLRTEPLSMVLRDISRHYSFGRSALGMVLPELCDDASTPHVQAIWTWDLENKGNGMTDQELEAALAGLHFE